jgi:hypothetical protein
MSNNQVELEKRLGATWIGKETAFADGLNPLRCFPKETPMLKVADKPVPNTDESATPFERRRTRRGQRSSMGKLTLGFAGDPVVAVVASTPTDNIPQDAMLESLLGGRWRGLGSTVLVSSTTTNILVTATHVSGGLRFIVGQSVAIPVAGKWYVRRITALNTGADSFTVYPPLPGSPTTGGIIHNGTFWYPTWKNNNSMCMQHVQADSVSTDWDQIGRGMTGDLAFNLKAGELISFTSALMGADGDTWGDHTLSASDASPITGDDFYNVGALTHLKAYDAAAFEHVPLQDIAVSLNLGNYLKGEYGGTNGITGVGRKAMSPLLTVEIKAMADRDMLTAYLAGTTFSLYMIVSDGASGAAERFAYFDIPGMRMPEVPDYEGVVEEARQGSYKFEATNDPSNAGGTDAARAPFRCGIL